MTVFNEVIYINSSTHPVLSRYSVNSYWYLLIFPIGKGKGINKHENQNQVWNHHSSYFTEKFLFIYSTMFSCRPTVCQALLLTLGMEWWTRQIRSLLSWNFHSSGGRQTVNSPGDNFRERECYEEHQTGWRASKVGGGGDGPLARVHFGPRLPDWCRSARRGNLILYGAQ